MNFLITGGAGSVGRDLTASLLEKGHSVRVLEFWTSMPKRSARRTTAIWN